MTANESGSESKKMSQRWKTKRIVLWHTIFISVRRRQRLTVLLHFVLCRRSSTLYRNRCRECKRKKSGKQIKSFFWHFPFSSLTHTYATETYIRTKIDGFYLWTFFPILDFFYCTFQHNMGHRSQWMNASSLLVCWKLCDNISKRKKSMCHIDVDKSLSFLNISMEWIHSNIISMRK